MFGFNKKQRELKKDPEKAIEYADMKLNTGVSGFIAKTFMGKDFTDDMNKSLQAGRDALEMQKQYQNPELNGLPGTAEVVSIQDTGKLVNFNPVVTMHLRVQPQYEPPFETTVEVVVSKLAIPRPGNTVHIKYAPADHSQIVIN